MTGVRWPTATAASRRTATAGAERWRAFPAPEVIDEMRTLGITHVMVHAGGLDPAQVEGAAA
ncbi:MAG: hypothetical protein R2712_24590 [Vicinamibacterales bacterium]